jgi:hypothetical protein
VTARVVAGPTLTRKATRAPGATRRVAGQRPAVVPDLDTSAQLRNLLSDPRRLAIELDELAKKPLTKRARRKYLTRAISTALAEYAKTSGSPLQKSYRNSVYCCEFIGQRDGKLKPGNGYCGNRWCLVCASIRTARAWDAHKPTIDRWRHPQFVTLTIPNVTAAELPRAIAGMLAVSVKVKDSLLKTDRVPLVALRKLECTYNRERDDYHPHLHYIVESRQMARLLVARWLDHYPAAVDRAQDIRAASKGTVAEMFKYFTKLVTKAKMMPAAALDTIFRAMKGRRVFQSVGYIIESDDDDESAIELETGTNAPTRRDESIDWEWCQSLADWVDLSTGDTLTGYEPAERFRVFVESVSPAAGAGE